MIQNHSSNHKSLFWGVLITAILIRLPGIFLWQQIPEIVRLVEGGDAMGYSQLADTLLSTGTFGFTPGYLTAFRMPGYPLFLAATFLIHKSPLIAQILQILADIGVVFITIQIGEAITKNHFTASLAGFGMAINPLTVISSLTLYPESLSTLFLCLAILVVIRSKNVVKDGAIAGLALGISIYLKPTFLACSLVLAGLFAAKWVTQKDRKSAMLAAIYPLLIISGMLLPWGIRNYIVMGAFIPMTTSNGVNLFRGNNPEADGGSVSNEPFIRYDLGEVESNGQYVERAWKWIRQNPADFLRLLPAKAFRFVWPLSLNVSGVVRVQIFVTIAIAFIMVSYYGFILLGSIYLIGTNRAWEWVVLASPFFVLLLLSLMTHGGARFAIPAFPTSTILAALGIESFIEKYRLDRRFRWIRS